LLALRVHLYWLNTPRYGIAVRVEACHGPEVTSARWTAPMVPNERYLTGGPATTQSPPWASICSSDAFHRAQHHFDKHQAQEEYHDKLKASLWEQQRLGIKPRRSWKEAGVRWLA
jgi:hypothetical protein